MDCKENRETLLCQCDSEEHQLTFVWFEDEELKDGIVYMEVHLKPLPFWQRLKNGIKYIFGHRSIYGDFDEFLLARDDYKKMYKVGRYLKKQQC